MKGIVYLLMLLFAISLSSAATLDLGIGRHWVSFTKTPADVNAMAQDCLIHQIIEKKIENNEAKPAIVLNKGTVQTISGVETYIPSTTEHRMNAKNVYEIMNFKPCKITFNDEDFDWDITGVKKTTGIFGNKEPGIVNGGNYVTANFEITASQIERICGVKIKRGSEWTLFTAITPDIRQETSADDYRFYGAFNEPEKSFSFKKGFFNKMLPYRAYYIEVSGLAEGTRCPITSDDLKAPTTTTAEDKTGITLPSTGLPARVTPVLGSASAQSGFGLERGINAVGILSSHIDSELASKCAMRTFKAGSSENSNSIAYYNRLANVYEGISSSSQIPSSLLPARATTLVPVIVSVGSTCIISNPATLRTASVLYPGTNFFASPVELTKEDMETIIDNCVSGTIVPVSGGTAAKPFATLKADGSYEYSSSLEAGRAYFVSVGAVNENTQCQISISPNAETGKKVCRTSNANNECAGTDAAGPNALLPGK